MTPPPDGARGAEHPRVTSLVDLLTLEELDTNLYRASNPAQEFLPRLYGGQVAAQALRAAAHTVEPDRVPHSVHGYFLRQGRADLPTILHVDRDRDGRSFSARHVNAVQEGKVIFSVLASFHVGEPGHRRAAPADARRRRPRRAARTAADRAPPASSTCATDGRSTTSRGATTGSGSGRARRSPTIR